MARLVVSVYRPSKTSTTAHQAHRDVSNDGRMAYGDEIHWAYHVSACTCSDGAVANTDQGLCGASKVVKTATDGPCGVAARGCAASGAMATHGTMQTNDATLHASYHSNRI